MRRAITISLTSLVLAVPIAGTAEAAIKAKVVIRKFSGAAYQVDHYGSVKVVITVRKTTRGTKVTRRITAVSVPVYPNSSGRSSYISENAIPILRSEALSAQSANIDLVSGATDLSEAFVNSLQSAILKAKRA
jgi:uncharacterized protein with FMN-binding domain